MNDVLAKLLTDSTSRDSEMIAATVVKDAYLAGPWID